MQKEEIDGCFLLHLLSARFLGGGGLMSDYELENFATLLIESASHKRGFCHATRQESVERLVKRQVAKQSVNRNRKVSWPCWLHENRPPPFNATGIAFAHQIQSLFLFFFSFFSFYFEFKKKKCWLISGCRHGVHYIKRCVLHLNNRIAARSTKTRFIATGKEKKNNKKTPQKQNPSQ